MGDLRHYWRFPVGTETARAEWTGGHRCKAWLERSRSQERTWESLLQGVAAVQATRPIQLGRLLRVAPPLPHQLIDGGLQAGVLCACIGRCVAVPPRSGRSPFPPHTGPE